MIRFSKKKLLPQPQWISVVPVALCDGYALEYEIPATIPIDHSVFFLDLTPINREVWIRKETYKRFQAELVDGRLKFTEPPQQGVALRAVVLGERDAPDAAFGFQIYPVTLAVSQLVDRATQKRKEVLRKKGDLDGVETYVVVFDTLVVDWFGFIDDETGQPMECDAEAREALIRQNDPGLLGTIVAVAANDLARGIAMERKAELGS